jgi:protein SCO1/2
VNAINKANQMFFRRVVPLLLIALLQPASSHHVAASSKTAVKTAQKGFVTGLIDHNGAPATLERFTNKPTLVHFGFTHCPDVCPTTLSEVSALMSNLGPDADRINFVFVTVDPARDTTDVLKNYLSHFDERIVGLTGSEKAIAVLAKSFNAAFAKRPQVSGYSIDHAIFAYLKDRQWRTVGTLYMGVGASRELIEQKLGALLSGRSN